MQPLSRAEPHQPVIGGMVLDAVEATALGIEGAEPRSVLVGLPPKLGGGRTNTNRPKAARFPAASVTLTRDRLAQRHIGREQVHVGKGRALIQSASASRAGHGSPPPQ